MREGWRKVRVSDVAQVIGGGTPKTFHGPYWDGDIPWITPKDLSDRPALYTAEGSRSITEAGVKGSGAQWLPAGTVLLSTRAPIGYVTIAARPLTTNQGFKSLVLADGQLPEYWYYLLSGSTEYLRSRAPGSTFPELSKRAVEALEFALPPVQEQRRIVDLMNHVDSHAGALRAELNAVSEAHLAWLASLNARADAEKWVRQPLAQFTEGTGKIQTGPFGSQLHRSDYVADGEIPVVMPANMSDWAVNLDGIARITSSMAEPLSRHLLREGDIAWARRGDVTRFAVIDHESAGALCGTGCFLIRPPDPGAASWLHTWLKTPSVASYLLVSAVGGTMDNLNAGILGAISVAIPPPAVIDDLSQLGRSTESHQQALKKEIAFLKEVRSAVLSSLLAGKHQIPASYDEFIRDEEVA